MSDPDKPFPLLRVAIILLLIVLGLAVLLWPLTPPWGKRRHTHRPEPPVQAPQQTITQSSNRAPAATTSQISPVAPQPSPDAERRRREALAARLEKRKQDIARLRADTATLAAINMGLSNLARMKALPPWVPPGMSADDAKSATYDDHPPLGGNIRVGTDSTYMRLDNIADSTTLKVLEIRHDQNGLPINRTSVSNGPYRASLTPPVETGGDPFLDRAIAIFQGMGYNMSDFVLCPKAGENYDARVGDKFIAIRSFMRKGRPKTSYPNLSLNLCSPDGTASAAYVTGYFVFVNGNLTSQ
jgi:hypothetical protein